MRKFQEQFGDKVNIVLQNLNACIKSDDKNWIGNQNKTCEAGMMVTNMGSPYVMQEHKIHQTEIYDPSGNLVFSIGNDDQGCDWWPAPRDGYKPENALAHENAVIAKLTELYGAPGEPVPGATTKAATTPATEVTTKAATTAATTKAKPATTAAAGAKYEIAVGTHCGGTNLSPLNDGTVRGWIGDIAECEAKCLSDENCIGFIFRESDGGCFWTSGELAPYTFAGHTCYAKISADECVESAVEPLTTATCICGTTSECGRGKYCWPDDTCNDAPQVTLITGRCSGNTDNHGDVNCTAQPIKTVNKGKAHVGSTVEDCCEAPGKGPSCAESEALKCASPAELDASKKCKADPCAASDFGDANAQCCKEQEPVPDTSGDTSDGTSDSTSAGTSGGTSDSTSAANDQVGSGTHSVRLFEGATVFGFLLHCFVF